LESQTANGYPVLQRAGTTSREALLRNRQILIKPIARSPERARKILCFSLDNDLDGCQLEEYQIETAPLAIFANFLPFDDTFIVVEK
jgi:hypothetical protein